MPTFQISPTAVRPDYPADTNSLSQYFSHIKAWSRERGASDYLPPTRSHFEKFEREFLSRQRTGSYGRRRVRGVNRTREAIARNIEISSRMGLGRIDLTDARDALENLRYNQICGVSQHTVTRCVSQPQDNYSGSTFKYGQLGVLLIQHALNVYAVYRQHTPNRGSSLHKISFICPVAEDRREFQDSAFYNRCVLYMRESRIKTALQKLAYAYHDNDFSPFWLYIMDIYDGFCGYNLICNDTRPTVENGQPENINATATLQQAARPPRPVERGGFRGTPVRQVVEPNRADLINRDDQAFLRRQYFQRSDETPDLEVDFAASMVGMNYRNMPQNVQEALRDSLLKHLKPAYELVMGQLVGVEVSDGEGD